MSGPQPWAPTRPEKPCAAGFQRSLWQPSEVTSLAATPLNRQDQYCG